MAYGGDELCGQAKAVGADAILLKPVFASHLVNTIMGIVKPATVGQVSLTASERETPPRLAGVRLLLVEDDVIDREVAIGLLGTAGITEIAVACNGREALDILAKKGPTYFHAVLMDVQMPEIDSYEATRMIRSRLGFRDLPVIGLTAHAIGEERQRSLDAGMNAHIAKSLTPRSLFTTLKAYIDTEHLLNGSAAMPQSGLKSSGIIVEAPAVFNVGKAMERMGGDLTLFTRIVTLFSGQYHCYGSVIRQALAGVDLKKAEGLAHAIKGAAASLSAETVVASAAALEMALRDVRQRIWKC